MFAPSRLFCAVVVGALAATSQMSAQSPSVETAAMGKSWDDAYRDPNGPGFSVEPNAFLVEVSKGLTPGAALDVGMGQGRNAIYLARNGWTVTGFDVSYVAVEQARAAAEDSAEPPPGRRGGGGGVSRPGRL